MKRKHKQYDKPKKAFDSDRIKEENKLVKKYGLKNKKEVWKSEAKVKYFRSRAKSIITADKEIQEAFFGKLNNLGLDVHSVADVLALNKENILKRRLASVVSERGLADTPGQARQMVVHKRIMIDGRIMNVPSYLVKVAEEGLIKVKVKIRKPKPVEVKEEVAEEVSEKIEEPVEKEKTEETPEVKEEEKVETSK